MLGRVAADNELESDLTSNSQSAPDTSTQENTQTSASSASYPVDTSQASRSPDAAAGQRGLSPGSIDVLGTLLSVAASATAASLFSPGLHLNNPSGIAPLNSPMSTTNPLSSVPPAGLGALGGLGGLAGLGLNPGVPSTAPGIGQDNRMRNMWENIRERMGLIPRTPGLPDAINPGERILDDVATQERTPRMRPGELMLAEMARALNAGLGLANSTERRAGDRTAEVPSGPGHVLFASTADPSQPLPPEGSFERFLVNLQTDLRAILTEDGSSTQPESTPLAQPDANTPPVQDLDATSSAPHVDSSVQDAVEPSALDVEDEGQPLSPPASSNTDSDSDGEYEEAEDEDEDSQDVSAGHLSLPPAPRTPTPIPPTGGIPYNLEESFITDNQASQDTGAHRPAINLWRLYRFEAVPANQTQDHASRTSSPPTTGPNITSTTPPSSPPSPLAARPSQGRPGEPDPRANVVVPVIVVGLQSVDVAGQDEAEDEAMMPLYQYESGSSGPTDDPSNGGTLQDGPAGRSGTARGRTWQSRAANAFRTLRPGRRGGSRSRRTAEGAGSRTFLIYVIGGYYPPNHHMVTGSDRLDSYEALWELAELLGQVKPPTATRQDIDNSGLQIIKASELGMYEQQGRIASNCVDRCLVCLDDYETEDELRLMTCRHAFHKGCVDKWLQIGRNNCPACRTKGVSVFGESSPEPTETATESQS
ncbi:hypothetical protein EW026_g2793 [Hermanssonia centrifuga]|uniref:RING-type domain-containing protein n=1 Tax=Hermanssonia centrifuga TaxID=98765 RepID=A0A4S4KRS2_9APHY|nr:hypothetical protein EW026_g2793 [Hermanssonia centrifuga]